MSIPNVPSFVPGFNVPTANITPFTYRDGLTYLQRLERLARYINRDLIPFVETNFNSLSQTWIDTVNQLMQQIIDGSIELQDPVLATILSDEESEARTVLQGLLESVIQDDPEDPGTYMILEPPVDPGEGGMGLIPDPENPGFWMEA